MQEGVMFGAVEWIIVFEDQGRSPIYLGDEDTALTVFEQMSINWNCHLFYRVSSKAGIHYPKSVAEQNKVLTEKVGLLQSQLNDVKSKQLKTESWAIHLKQVISEINGIAKHVNCDGIATIESLCSKVLTDDKPETVSINDVFVKEFELLIGDTFRFPVELRKMWSSSEVSSWVNDALNRVKEGFSNLDLSNIVVDEDEFIHLLPYSFATLVKDAKKNLGLSEEETAELLISLYEGKLITNPCTYSNYYLDDFDEGKKIVAKLSTFTSVEHVDLSFKSPAWNSSKADSFGAIRPTYVNPYASDDFSGQIEQLYRLIVMRFLSQFDPSVYK